MIRVKENILPFNAKGQAHGYWEYWFNCHLCFKCIYNNDERIGYEEDYDYFLDNKLTKNYHL